jgi:NTP-dependent ternary conflict system VMAP-like protein
VRSLERMRAAHWRRVWRDRWHSLIEDPSPTRIHFAAGADGRQVEAVLSDPHWVSMVLDAPVERPGSPGADALTAALRSGLPLLIWHPDLPPEELREIVDWLVESGGLIDVPHRAQVSRQAALGARPLPIDLEVARDVVILWDDPTRLVELDARPM